MFNYGSGCYSLADIAAATGGNRSNNDGFGDGSAWWIIILFLFVFCGWGNNGYGSGGFGGGNGGGRVADNYILATDFSNIERKIDGVNNGLCDGFYALNSSLLNGFNTTNSNVASAATGIQQTLCQGFNGLSTAYLTGTNALSSQFADCCCKIERSIDGINYNNATQACATQTAIANAARDIIENANANYRALHEENVAMQMAQKDDRIAELTASLNKADLRASQAAQNAYLINEIRPCPIPAYPVANPFCCQPVGFQLTNGCGCGC